MADSFLPPRLRGRYKQSRWALPVGQPEPETPEVRGGILGTGIGPKVNLGLGQLATEIGMGATALASLLTPGSKAGEPGWAQAGKGLLSSALGTAETFEHLNPVLHQFSNAIGADEMRREAYDDLGLTEDAGLRPKPLWDRASERGILPALVEDVGNVALVGSAVTAPLKAGSVAARFTGATDTAARLAAVHEGLISNPGIRVMQHPYQTAGRALRTNVTGPALARKLATTGATTPTEGIDFLAAELPDTGVDYSRVQVDMDRHARTAEAYNALPDVDDAARPAYDAFRTEVAEQYRHLTEDLGVAVEFVDEDPYPGAPEMLDDLRTNKRLKVYRTKAGEDHPYLTPEENDQFRAVHDAFGHAATGRHFDRHGEEAAFLAHRSMFSDEAGQAMATETRGQNSVLIAEGSFPRQKAALLPDDLADPAEAIAAYQRQRAGSPVVGRGTGFLARIEEQLVGREAHHKALRETRLADKEKREAMRSPAVRTSVAVARDHLMNEGKTKGISLSRRVASEMVGEEVFARMSGIKALEDEYLARGVPEDFLVRAGLRHRFVPTELRTPEFEAAVADAVAAQTDQQALVRQTLQESRPGDRGLQDTGAMDPALTKQQQRTLRQAEKKLERAWGEVQERKIARQRGSRETYVAALQDKLGRIAHAARQADLDAADAVAAFDHSRQWVPKAWRSADGLTKSAKEIYERTIADVAKNDGVWGGASFNPHENRFVVGGHDTGFAVGLVPGTALAVPLAEFSPAHIETVIRAFQDSYQHPGTIVGTWVEDGVVHIDPSEITATVDDALLRGAARQQLAVYDIAADDAVTSILRDRPDVAAQFLDKHTNLSRRWAELRDVAARTALTRNDVDLTMDLLMRQAARAQDLGLVKHPDEFFSKHVARFEFAKRVSRKGGVLRQVVLERAAGTPAERQALWREVEANVKDLNKVRRWYTDSHDLVERLFREQADVTLLDGSKINPADLFYQVLAVTSFQAMPRDNFTRAMTAFQRFENLPRAEMKPLIAALKKVTAGKATLESAFGLTEVADGMSGFALYPEPRQYLAEIFAGRGIDKWTPEHLAEAAAAFGKKQKVPDADKALSFIEQNYPGLVERIGPEAAVKEFWGRQHRAKIITFWDNLRNPDTSLGVTMDQQMERIFGVGMREAGGDAWIRYSEAVRDMAQELSEATGSRVMPHEIQAALWVFAKDEVNRIQVGHFRALAEDAQEMVHQGIQIADENDPIQVWIDEASEPYRSDETRAVRKHRIQRDGTDLSPPAPGLIRVWRGEGAHDPTLVNEVGATTGAAPGSWYTTNRKKAAGWAKHAEGGRLLYLDFDPRELVTDRDAQGVYRLQSNHNDYRINDEGLRAQARQVGPTTSVEEVVYRPGWGALNRDRKIELFEKRRVKWLAARAEINAALEIGDPDLAGKHLSRFVSDMTTKAPRSLGLMDDASGGSFLDIWQKGEFHSAGFKAAAETFDRLPVQPGELPPLLQSFRDKVLGEFVPLDDGTRGVIRVFEDGNFATLVHENGHLLRRLLPEGEMAAVERAYGIKDGWKTGHEEDFANDFVEYMRAGKAPKGLQTTFARVREVLRDIWAMVSGTFQNRRVHPELQTVFEDWLNPATRDMPEDTIPGLKDIPAETGTLRQRATRAPRFPEPPAGKQDWFAAGRKGQLALAKLEKAAAKKRSTATATAQVEREIAAVQRVLDEGRLPAELERDAMTAAAARTIDSVNRALGTPSVTRVPARWQPLYDAVRKLGDEAKQSPDVAGLLADLPETLHEIQQRALTAGFNPVHVRDFTPTQVRRLVFGNLRLGLGRRDLAHEVQAGTRKSRTGALNRAGGVDRSIESFLAATVEATNEKRTNAVVTWVEQQAARTIQKGDPIPAGWALWDPMRTFLLTGEEVRPGVASASQNAMIVPEPVIRTLDRFTKDYDHWAFRAIRKVTSPWRTLVLTLSPGWYSRNIVGNIALAVTEGVSLQDWTAAWRSYRAKDEIGRFADVPFVTSDTLAQEALIAADDSVIPRRGIGEAVQEGGRIRGSAQYAARSMLRVNEVVDEFARAAVYHRGRRLNMTPEAAWERAKNALVDYSALSPFERSAVRSVIPFYSWQKGILKVVMGQAMDHPARVGLLMLLGRMQEDYIAERFDMESGDIPDYYKHLVGRYNVRSFNPFSDPAEILSVEGLSRSLNPFLELAVRKGMGAPEFFTDRQRLGYFGSPQQDVDVPTALGEMVTRSPGGRIISSGPGQNLLGLSTVDDSVLRSRFLKARKQVRGVPNPETGTEAPSFLPPRLRSAA